MKKKYLVSREDLLSCCNEQGIVEIDKVIKKFNFPINIIKSNCKEFKLRFQHGYSKKNNISTIQCPCCPWSGNFQFSSHMIKAKDQKHTDWIANLISLYVELKSVYKASEKVEMSAAIIKKILKKLNVLKSNKMNKSKCPCCDWEGFILFSHISEMKDDRHDKFKEDIIKKYLEEKMSPGIIAEYYNISISSVKKILKNLNIPIRSHLEAVANAVEMNRHNINAYGIGGKRKDLNNEHYRSIPEANFARYLNYKNLKFKHEVAYKLFDEDGKFITTYFLDFLVDEKYGFEIKAYDLENGDFKNREKIILFKKQHPEIELKVLFCIKNNWKSLCEKYSKLIPLWETTVRNIKTNPEIYT